MDRQALIEQFFSVSQNLQRVWKGHFYTLLSNEKLSPAQLGMLFLLKSKQPVTNRDIAAELHITPSAVTQLFDALSKLGYVKREEDPSDRRITYLRLSEAGSTKVEQLEQRRKELFVELANALTDQELELIIKIQSKMTKKLEL